MITKTTKKQLEGSQEPVHTFDKADYLMKVKEPLESSPRPQRAKQ